MIRMLLFVYWYKVFSSPALNFFQFLSLCCDQKSLYLLFVSSLSPRLSLLLMSLRNCELEWNMIGMQNVSKPKYFAA